MLGISAYGMLQAPSDVWEKIKGPVTKQDVLFPPGHRLKQDVGTWRSTLDLAAFKMLVTRQIK